MHKYVYIICEFHSLTKSFAMWNPVTWSKLNQTNVDTTKYFLHKSAPHFLWKENEKVLDIGCGDGGVTINCILPSLPEDFDEVIGIDKSPAMINFAKTTHKSNPKIKFFEFEVPDPLLVQQFPEYFDHVFSFYTLQWVPNSRDAFRNIFNVLKPGGQALITMPVCQQLDVLSDLYENKNWGKYMQNFHKEQTFPYQWHPDPASLLKKHLIDENFEIGFCDLKEIVATYPKMAFEETSVHVNPYVMQIPLKKREEFIQNYLQHIKDKPTVFYKLDNDGNEKVTWIYHILAALVYKS